MTKATLYSLVSAEGGKSRLLRDGRAGPEVEGSLLEDQFQLRGSHLLWLTDGSPHDEGLHIYLLDAQGSILDAVEAGATFAPGVLKIQDTGENWLEFQFFLNGTKYRLEVDEEPRFRLPLPDGWRYKERFRKHRLTVHKGKS